MRCLCPVKALAFRPRQFSHCLWPIDSMGTLTIALAGLGVMAAALGLPDYRVAGIGHG